MSFIYILMLYCYQLLSYMNQYIVLYIYLCHKQEVVILQFNNLYIIIIYYI